MRMLCGLALLALVACAPPPPGPKPVPDRFAEACEARDTSMMRVVNHMQRMCASGQMSAGYCENADAMRRQELASCMRYLNDMSPEMAAWRRADTAYRLATEPLIIPPPEIGSAMRPAYVRIVP